MITTLANADNLATFLVIDKSLEVCPESIRFQPNVRVEISFSEYLKFIDEYLKEYDFLQTPTYELKKYLKSNDYIELTRCYYRDISAAVIKELYYCHNFHRNPTKIRHKLNNTGVDFNREQLQSIFNKSGYREVDKQLLCILTNRGYKIRVPDMSYFVDEWLYARSLFWSSFGEGDMLKWNYFE